MYQYWFKFVICDSILKVVDSIETYRIQQLEKLRENYNQQSQRIRWVNSEMISFRIRILFRLLHEICESVSATRALRDKLALYFLKLRRDISFLGNFYFEKYNIFFCWEVVHFISLSIIMHYESGAAWVWTRNVFCGSWSGSGQKFRTRRIQIWIHNACEHNKIWYFFVFLHVNFYIPILFYILERIAHYKWNEWERTTTVKLDQSR